MMRTLLSTLYHFSSLRSTDHGLLFEPLDHCLLERPKPIAFHDASGVYGVCQDDAHYVHIMYVNIHHQLIHIAIEPCTLQAHKRELSGSFQNVRHIHLTSCCNQLHAFLQYRSRVEHVSLSGIHWSSPAVVHHGEEILSLRLLSMQEHVWICLALITSAALPQQQVRLLMQSFHPASRKWSTADALPDLQFESSVDILTFELFPIQERVSVFLFQQTGNKLFFTAYESSKQKKWLMTAQSHTLIPPIHAEYVVSVYAQGQFRLSWVTEELLFRIHYHIDQEAWSDLYTSPIQRPRIYTCISDKRSSSSTPQKWIASDNEDGSVGLNGMEAARVEGYRATRNLTHSMDAAKSVIDSLTQMRERSIKMKSELVQMKKIQQSRQVKAQQLGERIAVLQEEVHIRKALFDLRRNEHILMKKDAVPNVQSNMKERLSQIILTISKHPR